MHEDTFAPLAAQFETHEVVGQIHDVPPHAVYEVRVDGRRAVYKHDTGPRGNAGVEGRVTRWVGVHTALPVPAVLAVGDSHFVAAWHSDAPAPDAARETADWARAAGRGLATLHAETAPLLDGYGHLAADGDALALPDRDWQDAVLAAVRHRRPVLAEHGHADVADAALEFLRENPGRFAGAGAPVCCHGWWSPEHVAVETGGVAAEDATGPGGVACVLDFEHAWVAPGEWDVWRTALPVFDGGEDPAWRAFRAGYESVRALPDGFAARRPLYVLLHTVYFFESLYVQDQHGPAATRERASRLRDAVFEILDDLA